MTAKDDLLEGWRLAWGRLRLIGRGARRLTLLGVVLAMLALNVASLTLSGVNAMASAAIAALTSLDPVSSRERRARLAAEERAEEASQAARRASVEGESLRADRDRLLGQVETSERRLASLGSEVDDLHRARNGLAGQVDTLSADLAESRAGLRAASGALLQAGEDLQAAGAEASRLRVRLDAVDAAQWVEMGGERLTVREAVSRTVGRVRDRTARVATANLGSMVGESIPVYGIAVVVAATTFELASACQSMQDMHDLEVTLGVADPGDEQVSEVCGLQVPTAGELWASIRASPGVAWDGAASALSALGEVDLPRPDFAGRWARTTDWLGSWFEE